jgi:hypothetical protein
MKPYMQEPLTPYENALMAFSQIISCDEDLKVADAYLARTFPEHNSEDYLSGGYDPA